MTDLPLLRFIPFRRRDLLAMCIAEGLLDVDATAVFRQACDAINQVFQQQFHDIKQRVKDAYAPLDPDADTRLVELSARRAEETDSLVQLLSGLLERANYEKVAERDLQRALGAASLFQVRLYVDMDDFEEVLLYTRGASRREETLREFFGLWRRRVKFINDDRVLLYIRFRQDIDSDSALGDCRGGSTMLKLFQNVPAADLEMLFPNIRVGMRWLDRLLIGVPALGGYCWKQFSNFRNRKLKYTQALTENLYFKLLDNNAGVLFRLLDGTIEQWLADKWHCRIDFEIDDALAKLARLGLALESAGSWRTTPLSLHG